MYKLLIMILFTFSVQAKSLDLYKNILVKLGTYSSQIGILLDVFSYLEVFSKEQQEEVLLLKEKKIYPKESQYRRVLNNSVLGYLGARFNHQIEKEIYAYAFVSKHSKNQALKSYIKHNELNQKKENLIQGTFVKFRPITTMITKKEDKYIAQISYYLDEYKNLKKKGTKKFNSVLEISIDPNKKEFYFYVNKFTL